MGCKNAIYCGIKELMMKSSWKMKILPWIYELTLIFFGGWSLFMDHGDSPKQAPVSVFQNHLQAKSNMPILICYCLKKNPVCHWRPCLYLEGGKNIKNSFIIQPSINQPFNCKSVSYPDKYCGAYRPLRKVSHVVIGTNMTSCCQVAEVDLR